MMKFNAFFMLIFLILSLNIIAYADREEIVSTEKQSQRAAALQSLQNLLSKEGFPVDKANLRRSLHSWSTKKEEKAKQEILLWQIRPSEDAEFPFTLTRDGVEVLKLKKYLGEGITALVYLTEHNTALKFVKKYSNARRQTMQLYTQPILEAYGIPVPRIQSVNAVGMYIETEYVPGGSVEYRFASRKGGLPHFVKEQVLDIRKKAILMANETGLFLDLKAANFQLNKQGKIILVDSSPRTNDSFGTFYYQSGSKLLSEEEFLRRFLYLDIEQKTAYRAPKGSKDYERKVGKPSLAIGSPFNIEGLVSIANGKRFAEWSRAPKLLQAQTENAFSQWMVSWKQEEYSQTDKRYENLINILRELSLKGIDIGDIEQNLNFDGQDWYFLYDGSYATRVATPVLLNKYESAMRSIFAKHLSSSALKAIQLR